MSELTIVKDADALAVDAAGLITRAAQRAVAESGRFTLALTGGSTPKQTYALLARPEARAQVDWGKVFVFWGDERFVRPDDDRSNYGMARRTLLAHVPIPDAHVFPMPTETGAGEEEAAAEYAGTLARFFGIPAHSSPPRFDLILLGMGDDGHIASLFPGAASLAVKDSWVVSSPPGTLPPPVDRLTLTFPVLNAARHVLFLISGEKKAEALRDVLEGKGARETRPAAGVQPVDGTLTWLVDEAAARLLARR